MGSVARVAERSLHADLNETTPHRWRQIEFVSLRELVECRFESFRDCADDLQTGDRLFSETAGSANSVIAKVNLQIRSTVRGDFNYDAIAATYDDHGFPTRDVETAATLACSAGSIGIPGAKSV